jgi:hypothetical protein
LEYALYINWSWKKEKEIDKWFTPIQINLN